MLLIFTLSIELILKFPVGDNSPENILKAKLLTSFPNNKSVADCAWLAIFDSIIECSAF